MTSSRPLHFLGGCFCSTFLYCLFSILIRHKLFVFFALQKSYWREFFFFDVETLGLGYCSSWFGRTSSCSPCIFCLALLAVKALLSSASQSGIAEMLLAYLLLGGLPFFKCSNANLFWARKPSELNKQNITKLQHSQQELEQRARWDVSNESQLSILYQGVMASYLKLMPLKNQCIFSPLRFQVFWGGVRMFYPSLVKEAPCNQNCWTSLQWLEY